MLLDNNKSFCQFVVLGKFLFFFNKEKKSPVPRMND